MIVAAKIDDNNISIKRTESKETTVAYKYEFLVEQRDSIIAQKNRDNILRDKELADINEIIAECVKLNIGEEVKDVI